MKVLITNEKIYTESVESVTIQNQFVAITKKKENQSEILFGESNIEYIFNAKELPEYGCRIELTREEFIEKLRIDFEMDNEVVYAIDNTNNRRNGLYIERVTEQLIELIGKASFNGRIFDEDISFDIRDSDYYYDDIQIYEFEINEEKIHILLVD